MWIAHRHENAIRAVGPRAGVLLRVLKAWLAHVDRHARHLAALHVKLEHLDAGKRLQAHGVALEEAALVDILAYAAARVATHHGLGAVGVENAHREVGNGGVGRRANEHQAVGADAEMAVAPFD